MNDFRFSLELHVFFLLRPSSFPEFVFCFNFCELGGTWRQCPLENILHSLPVPMHSRFVLNCPPFAKTKIRAKEFVLGLQDPVESIGKRRYYTKSFAMSNMPLWYMNTW